jgi:NDP-sugar pyrophosphorylase family protein
MKAIILAGGEGTRLRPLTLTTPKPLVDVQGKTLTEHVFAILKQAGVDEVIMSISYLADKIEEYLGDGSKFGLKISYLLEPTRMGTAGPFILLKRQGVKFDEPFFVVNGDNLFALDIAAWKEFHITHGGAATIALKPVADVSSRGVARLEDDRITEFVEKPDPKNAPSNLISSGYYLFSPQVFDAVDETKDFSMLEVDVFPALARAGLLYGFVDDGQWFDTGTLERYEEVKRDWRGVV